MIDSIINELMNKRILLLGFGKEGQSSLNFIRNHLPDAVVGIADKDQLAFTDELKNKYPDLHFYFGQHYLDAMADYDIVVKSPGVYLGQKLVDNFMITSQTDLFLQAFSDRTIGVTGTKGKSTTASLIHHLLIKAAYKSVLTGNIGMPCFDVISHLDNESIIVFELSANQLEYLQCSPHIAVLLNIYEEHLDHFGTFEAYKAAKMNIFRHGKQTDFLICQPATIAKDEPPPVQQQLDFYPLTKDVVLNIKGLHNLSNAGAALSAIAAVGIDPTKVIPHLSSFKGLTHRLEFIGNHNGVDFYNDSIATVPEATIAAIASIGRVDFLILGGFDRGIDYTLLINYLVRNPIRYILLTGEAGLRMANLLRINNQNSHFYFDTLEEILSFARSHAETGNICLLSPAAASYDRFKNFEHRGDHFKKLVIDFFGA